MAKLSPMEMLNAIKEKAKLDKPDYQNSIAIKLNKAGKIKFQLLALDENYLFKSRVQHFIPKLPDNEDSNETILVMDCQGQGCPACIAADNFKKSGVTLDAINEAYKPKFPYRYVKNLFTQPEYFLLAAKIISDEAEEGTYLPKDAQLGSVQLIQFSKTALNSLMSAYEDFLDDQEEDVDSLPPLFGIFDGGNEAKSLTISLRIQTQPYSYGFSFLSKVSTTKLEDIDKSKLDFLDPENDIKPSAEHIEKITNRIRDIQNYFTGANIKTENASNAFAPDIDDDPYSGADDDIPF